MFNFDFLLDDYFFNRPVKDMTPYKMVEKEGKLVIILNTLGISPKDIDVEVEDGTNIQFLKISGKTKNQMSDKEYSINMTFSVKKPMESVNWQSEDGLTYLEVKFLEPIKSKVLVNNKLLTA